MTKLPKSVARGQRWSVARRFQGWLASWAQDRRRARKNHLTPPPPAPGTPLELSGSYTGSDIEINWYTVDEALVLYVSVEKKTAGEPDTNYWEAAQVAPQDNAWVDSELIDSAYEYRVRSVGAGG